jgi:hypothetical protein
MRNSDVETWIYATYALRAIKLGLYRATLFSFISIHLVFYIEFPAKSLSFALPRFQLSFEMDGSWLHLE